MQLLISVTDVVEAQAALSGCADIIDVKNPAEGALGAASVLALRDLCGLLPPDRPSSAALGDSNTPAGALALAAYAAAQLRVSYVKVGLGQIEPEAAVSLLQTVQSAIRLANPACRLVAVAYADGYLIDALPWQQLPEIVAAAQVWGCMIDTAVKDGRNLFDHCSETELEGWLANCHQAGLGTALAGSLGLAQLPVVRRLQPDVVGFRGAACRGDRTQGRVEATLVAQLHTALFA